MVEFVRIGYRRLFEVRVLHHFWLDEGATHFDAIASGDVRARRLLTYDVRRVLAIEPSAATTRTVLGLRGVFRMSRLGFFVAVPDDAVVPLDADFEFFISPTDPDYSSYTSLSLRSQSIKDIADPANPLVVHHYKANVPVLGNELGVSRGSGAARRLFLSQEYSRGPGDGVEALVTSGDNLRQLTGDPPNAPFHTLGLTRSHPVYVHPGDVPAIIPPQGVAGAPTHGIVLASDTPPAVCAIIRLVPRRTDDAFSFVGANGLPRPSTRVFEIHFRNRWTAWRYREKNGGSVISTEDDPLPLTHFGNAGERRKPSPAAIDVEFDKTSPPRVTRLVSNVYV